MSGGEITIRPSPEETFVWEDNVLLGNTCLYGATGGMLLAAGRAGERFAVRNSGAVAVVEGVGDHGCEYMTRGAVVVLGRTGLNFGAGMSGGLAFVHDAVGDFDQRINPSMIALERLEDAGEIASLQRLIAAHAEATQSPLAGRLLDDWAGTVARFWKVVPHAPTADAPTPRLHFEPVLAESAPALAPA